MPSPRNTTAVATRDEALGAVLGRALRRPLLTAEEECRPARRCAAGDVDAHATRREALTALAFLAPRMRRVLALGFGLGDEPPMTRQRIGPLLGISPARRQIEADGLRRLPAPAERAS